VVAWRDTASWTLLSLQNLSISGTSPTVETEICVNEVGRLRHWGCRG
jgi:hypothetical protein